MMHLQCENVLKLSVFADAQQISSIELEGHALVNRKVCCYDSNDRSNHHQRLHLMILNAQIFTLKERGSTSGISPGDHVRNLIELLLTLREAVAQGWESLKPCREMVGHGAVC